MTRFIILLFHQAIVFSIPDIQLRLNLSEIFGVHLDLSSAQVRQFIQTATPPIRISDETISIGRISQTRSFTPDSNMSSSVQSELATARKTFSYTGVHIRVLQAALSCLRHREPILLVGDTGTGKTALVQHLAALFDRPAVVYNFSDQSESADLIGRTVPEDGASLIQRLRREFVALLNESNFLQQNQRDDLTVRANRRAISADLIGTLSLCKKVADRCVALLTQNSRYGFYLSLSLITTMIHCESLIYLLSLSIFISIYT